MKIGSDHVIKSMNLYTFYNNSYPPPDKCTKTNQKQNDKVLGLFGSCFLKHFSVLKNKENNENMKKTFGSNNLLF